VKELQKQADSNIIISLVGNKVDLAEHRAVSVQDAQSYADDNGILFIETSAKTAVNVNELFVSIGASRLPPCAPPTLCSQSTDPFPLASNSAKRLPKNAAMNSQFPGGNTRRLDNQGEAAPSGSTCC